MAHYAEAREAFATWDWDVHVAEVDNELAVILCHLERHDEAIALHSALETVVRIGETSAAGDMDVEGAYGFRIWGHAAVLDDRVEAGVQHFGWAADLLVEQGDLMELRCVRRQMIRLGSEPRPIVGVSGDGLVRSRRR